MLACTVVDPDVSFSKNNLEETRVWFGVLQCLALKKSFHSNRQTGGSASTLQSKQHTVLFHASSPGITHQRKCVNNKFTVVGDMKEADVQALTVSQAGMLCRF